MTITKPSSDQPPQPEQSEDVSVIPPPPKGVKPSALDAEIDYSEELGALAVIREEQTITILRDEIRAWKRMGLFRFLFAMAIFCLVIAWLYFIAVTVNSCAIGWNGRYAFELDKTVLVALLTTTTVNVLGLFYIVAKWLFPANEKSPYEKHVAGQRATKRAQKG